MKGTLSTCAKVEFLQECGQETPLPESTLNCSQVQHIELGKIINTDLSTASRWSSEANASTRFRSSYITQRDARSKPGRWITTPNRPTVPSTERSRLREPLPLRQCDGQAVPTPLSRNPIRHAPIRIKVIPFQQFASGHGKISAWNFALPEFSGPSCPYALR